MIKDDHQQMKAWVEQWKVTGRALKKERKQRILETDSQLFLHQIQGMVCTYFLNNKMRKTSGLVEQQAYFRKNR